jgi:signal transduction histidine kinase
MFELFGKVKMTTDYNSTGVGLGLTYCKNVIQHMNGEIFCESEKGKGCTLSFYI